MKLIIILLLFCTSINMAMDKPPKDKKGRRKRQHAALLAFTQIMIAQKKDLNVPIKEGKFAGKTILTAAAHHRKFKDILDLALSAGADPNMPDGHNHTPLKRAVSAHCRTAFKCLINKGAIAKDKGLMQEICGAWHDVDTVHQKKIKKRVTILEVLLENKASPNELDELGNTCLYHLLWTWIPSRRNEKLSEKQQQTFYSQRKDMIRALLKAGLDITHKNNAGYDAVANIKAHPHLEDKELLSFLETESKKNYAVKQ